jgi:flagellar hook-length control protein FliK
MPEIASVASMPTAVPAPGAAAAPMPAAPVGAEPGTADFLAQLKAALKGLANVVAPMPTPVSPLGTAQLSTSPDANVQPTQPPTLPDVAAKTSGAQPADLPEILAALGFVLVPTPVQQVPAASAPTPDAANAATAAGGPTLAPARLLAAAVPGRIQQHAVMAGAADASPAPSQPDAAAAGQTTGTASGQSALSPEAAASALANKPADARAAALADSATAQAASQLTSQVYPVERSGAWAQSPTANAPHRTEMPAASSDAAATAVIAPSVAPQSQAEPRHSDAPAPGSTAAAPGAIGPHPQAQPGTAFSSRDPSGSGDRRDHASGPTTSVGDTSTSQATSPASQQTFAATVASTSAPAQSSAAQPSQVVSQIAHQADLYRLPGNRGVRIQLHPDDLGGVQVTLRYAATGGLELHINVEHASTGALVQAGWTELRDALATQGISPDRLVMSVIGPSSASQLDFSANGGNGGNGYRSDSGLAGFMQGDGGQQRNGGDSNNDTRTWRGWSGGPDPISSSDDMPRTAAPAAASRIDYRV